MFDPIYTVNIFLIPLISMYIYKKRNSDFSFSFETVCQYAITAVCLIFCVKIPLALLPVAFHANETEYTVIAAAVAVIVPFVWEIITKNFNVKLLMEKDNDEKK